MRRTKQLTTVISLGLTVLSVTFALIRRSPVCCLAAAAMGISTLGDALLAGVPKAFERIGNRLVKGGAVFFAAHVVYILALFISCGKGLSSPGAYFALPFAVFCALTVLHGALFYLRPRAGVPRAFFIASFAYLLTVGVHAAAAFAVWGLCGGGYALNAAGGTLFFVSDAILLARKYGAIEGKYTSVLIWAFYVPAQLCLMTGFFLA